MKMNLLTKVGASCIAATAMVGSASATLVSVTLHTPSNVGIDPGSFSASFNATTNTITINETWVNSGPGVIQISGLVPGIDYTVIKNLTNNTASPWDRLANELLDPLGEDDDLFDPIPYPGFVPTGFSTSNERDFLDFAQDSTTISREGDPWDDILADEITDARDFLDFYTGSLAPGETGSVRYGLSNDGPISSLPATTAGYEPWSNDGFLLYQRPNVDSTDPIDNGPDGNPTGHGVPDSGTTAYLLALSLFGFAGFRRMKRA